MARRDDVENESAPAVVAAPSFVLLTKPPAEAPLRDVAFDDLESVTRHGGWIVMGYYYATWHERESKYDSASKLVQCTGMRYLVAQTVIDTPLANAAAETQRTYQRSNELEAKLRKSEADAANAYASWTQQRAEYESRIRALEETTFAAAPSEPPPSVREDAHAPRDEEGDDHVAF